MRQVHVRTGCRLDLAGGTLDVWPIGMLHPGASTVNLAVEVAVEIGVELRPEGYEIRAGSSGLARSSLDELAEVEDVRLFALLLEHLDAPPLKLVAHSESPRGAGLGASSALAVATIRGVDRLFDRNRPVREVVTLARDIEARLMGLPTGCQDHYPPLLGGALSIQHRPGGESVQPLEVDLAQLDRHLLAFYSGESHVSGATNWGVFRRRLEGDPDTVARFERIAEIAREIVEPLETGDFAEVGKLVGQEWEQRKGLAEGVATPKLDQLLERAREAGAWGGKAAGAGGGGCVFVLGPEDRRGAIRDALTELGARPMAAAPRAEGPTVEVRQETTPQERG